MPKVGKVNYSYNHSNIRTFDIWFGSPAKYRVSVDKKNFYIKLPPDVAQTVNSDYGCAYGLTIEEVKKNFREKMEKYYSKAQKEKRVIGYHFEGEIAKNDSNTKNKFEEHELRFSYIIGSEITIGTDRYFKTDFSEKLNKISGSEYGWSDYRNFTFIDWTEDSEKWFANTYNSLKILIKACEKFFGQSEPKLIAAMKNQKLLELK